MLDTFMSSILGTKLPHNNPYLISTLSLVNIGLVGHLYRNCASIFPNQPFSKQRPPHRGVWHRQSPQKSLHDSKLVLQIHNSGGRSYHLREACMHTVRNGWWYWTTHGIMMQLVVATRIKQDLEHIPAPLYIGIGQPTISSADIPPGWVYWWG